MGMQIKSNDMRAFYQRACGRTQCVLDENTPRHTDFVTLDGRR